jgi:hypothetical protein
VRPQPLWQDLPKVKPELTRFDSVKIDFQILLRAESMTPQNAVTLAALLCRN